MKERKQKKAIMKSNIKKRERVITLIGIFFILAGLICNHWLVAKLFSLDGELDFSLKVSIFIFDLFFVFFGLLLVILRKKKDLAVNILLLFFTIILCLITAEIFLRISDKPNPSTVNAKGEKVYLFSKEYHHDYRPNQVFIRYPSEYDEFGPVENKINSLAVRGPEIPEKETDEYRVLLVGDSFIQADEIKYEETAGEVLNDLLGDEKIKVIQHGMSSWSPLLELNWLLKKGFDLKPDLIILFLCINDFYGSYSGSDIAYTKDAVFDSDGLPLSFELSSENFSSLASPRLIDLLAPFFSKKAHFTQKEIDYLLQEEKTLIDYALNSAISKDIQYGNLIKDIIYLSRPIELWDEKTIKTVSLSLGYLDKIKKITESKSISFAVSFVPLSWNISKEENFEGIKHYGFSNVIIPMGGIEEKIKKYALENNIDYINIYEEFKNFSGNNEEKLFLISEGHWSGTGHRVAAETLCEYIKEETKKQ